MSPTITGQREWCLCGHHDGSHDMEGEETQDCSAPGCICQVFRPTGAGMPEMNILNEHGTGLEADESGLDDESSANSPEGESVDVVDAEVLDEVDEDIEQLRGEPNPDEEDDDGETT